MRRVVLEQHKPRAFGHRVRRLFDRAGPDRSSNHPEERLERAAANVLVHDDGSDEIAENAAYEQHQRHEQTDDVA